MPRIAGRRPRMTWRLRLLLPCACAAAALPSTVDGQVSSISGVVYDSVARRPLSGATVQLVDTANAVKAYSIITGDNGAYRFDSVATGIYLLGFFHRTLDSLGIAPPLLQLTVTTAAQIRAPLAVPSAASVVRAHCGTAADSGGAWIGAARSAVTGLPVRGARVKVQWSSIAVEDKRIVREIPEVEAVSGETGFFVACYLPRDEIIVAHATLDADSSGVLTVLVPPDGMVLRDVFIAPITLSSKRVMPDSLDADSGVVIDVRSGSGTVRGRVTAKGGKPVSGARVRLGETGAEGETNQDGYYALDSLPLGSFNFDVRAIGYLPTIRPLDVQANQLAVADFELQSRAAFLDTVRVTGRRILESSPYTEFLERQKSGFGRFFDEAEMVKRDPYYVSDLLRQVPGALVLPGSFGGRVLFRGFGGTTAYCSPLVFIDGMRMGNVSAGGLEYVNARDVRAMEVYTRSSNVPMQFRGWENCGAIVITTGRREPERIPR